MNEDKETKEVKDEELKELYKKMDDEYWELYPLSPVIDTPEENKYLEEDSFKCTGSIGVGSCKYKTSEDIPIYEESGVINTNGISGYIGYVLVGVTPDRKRLAFGEVAGKIPAEEFGGVFAIIPPHTPDGTLFIAKSPIVYAADEYNGKRIALSLAREVAKKVMNKWKMQVEILMDNLKEEVIDVD